MNKKLEPRHALREKAMICLYQYLMMQNMDSAKDIKEILADTVDDEKVDPFLYVITVDTIKYMDTYIEMIDSALRDDWTFERLSYVERAILLMACCELDLEVSKKAIVINEAVMLAKQYCDDDSYKLINAVLDTIGK